MRGTGTPGLMKKQDFFGPDAFSGAQDVGTTCFDHLTGKLCVYRNFVQTFRIFNGACINSGTTSSANNSDLMKTTSVKDDTKDENTYQPDTGYTYSASWNVNEKRKEEQKDSGSCASVF